MSGPRVDELVPFGQTEPRLWDDHRPPRSRQNGAVGSILADIIGCLVGSAFGASIRDRVRRRRESRAAQGRDFSCRAWLRFGSGSALRPARFISGTLRAHGRTFTWSPVFRRWATVDLTGGHWSSMHVEQSASTGAKQTFEVHAHDADYGLAVRVLDTGRVLGRLKI